MLMARDQVDVECCLFILTQLKLCGLLGGATNLAVALYATYILSV